MAESGSEERVRAIAHRVYLNRQVRRRSGNAHSDWQTAITIAEKPLKRLLFWSHSGLLALPKLSYRSAKFVVWEIPKWGLFSLPKLEWVKLLAVPLVVAAAGSIITRNFQREAEQNRILKEYFALLETFTFEQGLLDEPLDSGVVLLARGRTVATLRELDLSRREQLIAFLRASDLAMIEATDSSDDFQEPIISLRDQNLSEMELRNINLSNLDFRFTDFRRANLQGATVWGANLQDAFFFEANLQDADFKNANLQDAFLWQANLQNAAFESANLQDAEFRNANLQDAVLIEADLQGAFLVRANLQSANLRDANLQSAILQFADLQGAFLGDADLQGANLRNANLQNLSLKAFWYDSEARDTISPAELEEQLAEAKLCGTILPMWSQLDGNRDCNSP
ncbi:MAG: pentapeptide repeat-containing protein [Leptolyngbyaceae cyanobacterium]